jgi:hypothetical protein
MAVPASTLIGESGGDEGEAYDENGAEGDAKRGLAGHAMEPPVLTRSATRNALVRFAAYRQFAEKSQTLPE